MSEQPKSRQIDRTPDKDAITTLPPKRLTPEQEEKVKGGLAASKDGFTEN